MKKLSAYIALLLLPALAGATLGYFMGQYLSNYNATVSLAKEIRSGSEFTAKGGKVDIDKLSIDAKEFMKTPGASDPSGDEQVMSKNSSVRIRKTPEAIK